MTRLHGFPDWFRFHVTKWHGARQIGNSVPPPLARAVADAVREALGFEPTLPPGSVPLGSSDLLRFGMTEAAAYWGVDVPIGRRDRKSGARKRKQRDIERALGPRRRSCLLWPRAAVTNCHSSRRLAETATAIG